MPSNTEIDAMLAIISNMPTLKDIAKQLKIKNKIALLQLMKDTGYPIDCDYIDDISNMLDNN